MIYIGIDNGVTGSVGVIIDGLVMYLPKPVRRLQDYTKKAKLISRLDHVEYKRFFDNLRQVHSGKKGFPDFKLMYERPMTDPMRKSYQAHATSLRCLEAELVIFEQLGIPHEPITSTDWQKVLLPKGTKGSAALKQASFDIGMRMFPQVSKFIMKQKDADGIFIAEYCRRVYHEN